MTNTNLADCWQQLGITSELRLACRLPLVMQASELVAAGQDVFSRDQQMTPQTLAAWQRMQQAATAAGITLQLVSAYRSIAYQTSLIQKKLDAGQRIEDILNVNAPPGFSEHHTGRALDLTTPGCEVLTEAFEQTEAYRWLCNHAGSFGFSLSYPRDNPFGIDYEPWHWAYGND